MTVPWRLRCTLCRGPKDLSGGLIALIVAELVAIAGVFAIVISYGIQGEMPPFPVLLFLVLLLIGIGPVFRAIVTRVQTLRAVSSGTLAVVRLLTRTDAYLPLEGLEASEALNRCRKILDDETRYEQRSAEGGRLRAVLKSRFASRRIECLITVDQPAQILHIRFEFERTAGGFLSGDERHEREIHRFVRCLHPAHPEAHKARPS
jgi:hypothetical protein